MVTTEAISRAKLQSNHHHQQISNVLQAGCPSCRPTDSVRALMGISKTHCTCKIVPLQSICPLPPHKHIA